MSIYMADFETTTREDDCRVWAWACVDLAEPEDSIVDNDIKSFISFISRTNCTCYFHNLKFDGSFILSHLFRAGYEHVIQKKGRGGKLEPLEPGQISTCISDMGQWYTMKVCWRGTEKTTEFRDSAKLIPLPVEDIPKAYGLPNTKLTIDYKDDREEGHILTEEEIAYVKEDVIIVAKAINIMRQQGQKKLTAAANALYDFQDQNRFKGIQEVIPQNRQDNRQRYTYELQRWVDVPKSYIC